MRNYTQEAFEGSQDNLPFSWIVILATLMLSLLFWAQFEVFASLVTEQHERTNELLGVVTWQRDTIWRQAVKVDNLQDELHAVASSMNFQIDLINESRKEEQEERQRLMRAYRRKQQAAPAPVPGMIPTAVPGETR